MEFGTLVMPQPDRAADDANYAEQRGFAQAWFPDSHMIYGDVYVAMATNQWFSCSVCGAPDAGNLPGSGT